MPSAGDIIEAVDVEIPGIQLGTVAWTSQVSNGTVTSGGTQTRDAVLGNVTFTVAAAQNTTRYRVVLAGRGVFGNSITGSHDRYTLNFRDGGASTPTTSSTLIGPNFNVLVENQDADQGGTAEVQAQFYASTWVPGTGVHNVGAFWVRSSGTGTGTPTGACEFYVEALGTI